MSNKELQAVSEAILAEIEKTTYTSTAGMDEVQSVIATAKSNYVAMTENSVRKNVKVFNATKDAEERKRLRRITVLSILPLVAKVALTRCWLFEGPLDAYNQLVGEAYSGFNRYAESTKKYEVSTLRFAAFMESTLMLKAYDLAEGPNASASARIEKFKDLCNMFNVSTADEFAGEKVWNAMAALGHEDSYFRTEERCKNAALDIRMGTLEEVFSIDYQVAEEADSLEATLEDVQSSVDHHAEQNINAAATPVVDKLVELGIFNVILSLPEGALREIIESVIKVRKQKKSVKVCKQVLCAAYGISSDLMEQVDTYLVPLYKQAM